jgi:ribosome-associated protein
MDDLRVTETITIPDDELSWTFSPSGGPGGQHANRSSTRAELRFHVTASRAFDEQTKIRLLDKLDKLDGRGVIVVVADDSRSQWRNRQIARRRLADVLKAALRPDPPKRRTTKPSRSARRRRVDEKRARSHTKEMRKPPGADD